MSQWKFGCLLNERLATVTWSMLMILSVAVVVRSQESSAPAATSSPSTPQVTSSPEPQTNSHYVIGVGDVVDIRVFGRPLLSRDAVRVDNRGMIRMPLLENEILAACRTEAGLAAEITTQYLKYVRRPQVDVFIREYN